MRLVSRLTLLSLCLSPLAGLGLAQSPPEGAAVSGKDRILARLKQLDRNKDGKLSRDEVRDERLLPLFDRADANKDGVLSKEELDDLAAKLAAEETAPGRRPGPALAGLGLPRPAQVLPPLLQKRLNLSAEQTRQLEALQKEVDRKLDRILTEEQKKLLEAPPVLPPQPPPFPLPPPPFPLPPIPMPTPPADTSP